MARHGKRVYRLTPQLVEGLQGARWPAAFPAEHFRPPVGCVALELPTPHGTEHVLWAINLAPPARATRDGILAAATSAVVYNAICWHYASDRPRQSWYALLDLSVPTLSGALDAARENAVRALREVNPALHDRTDWSMWSGSGIVNLATNALLYILGNDDIVEQVEYVERPKRRQKGPLSPKEQRTSISPSRACSRPGCAMPRRSNGTPARWPSGWRPRVVTIRRGASRRTCGPPMRTCTDRSRAHRAPGALSPADSGVAVSGTRPDDASPVIRPVR